jgi:hypothetical protein
MIGRDGAEDEIRVLLAEAVGALRIISESVGPLRRALVRQAIAEARRALGAAETLSDLLKRPSCLSAPNGQGRLLTTHNTRTAAAN